MQPSHEKEFVLHKFSLSDQDLMQQETRYLLQGVNWIPYKNDKNITKGFQKMTKMTKNNTCATKMATYGHKNMHVEYMQVT